MYALTTVHLGLVLAAIAFVVVMGFRVAGGQFRPPQRRARRQRRRLLALRRPVGRPSFWWCAFFLVAVPHRS